jgi:hypothetical protein
VRLLLAFIALSTVCQARPTPVDISGVWVLDKNTDGISTTTASAGLAMSVEVEACEVSVIEVRSDSQGHYLARKRYVVALRLSIPQKGLERLILRDEITGATEEWSLMNGKLTITTRPGGGETFHPAERWGIGAE